MDGRARATRRTAAAAGLLDSIGRGRILRSRHRLEKQRYGKTAGRIKGIGEPGKGRKEGRIFASRESKSRYQNGNSRLEANERMMGN